MTTATSRVSVPWYSDHSELVSFAYVLKELGGFEDLSESEADALLYFFEKPWKWDREHAEWLRLGRPLADAAVFAEVRAGTVGVMEVLDPEDEG